MIIYKITNLINDNKYIGQTVGDLDNRWRNHINDCKRFDYAIQRAIRKYGTDNFIIEEIDHATTQEQLNEKEKYWIKHYNTMVPSGYNIREGGSNGALSEETKRKISISKTGKKTGKPAWNRGIPRPDEEKKKISDSMMGEKNHFYGKTHSNESKRKISMSKQRRITNGYISFLSLTDAGIFYNTSKETIFSRIKSKTDRFKEWKYIN